LFLIPIKTLGCAVIFCLIARLKTENVHPPAHWYSNKKAQQIDQQ